MINSHLLYRLSYRGTSFFQPWTLPVLLDSRLRGAPFYGCARACQPSDPKSFSSFSTSGKTALPLHAAALSLLPDAHEKAPPKRGFPCPSTKRSGEDDLVAFHLRRDTGTRREFAGQDQLRQRVLDPALDGPLQRACAIDRVEADGDQLVQRLLAQFQAQLALGQALAQVMNSGRKCALTASITAARCASRSPASSWICAEPRLEVITTTVLRKSTVRP